MSSPEPPQPPCHSASRRVRFTSTSSSRSTQQRNALLLGTTAPPPSPISNQAQPDEPQLDTTNELLFAPHARWQELGGGRWAIIRTPQGPPPMSAEEFGRTWDPMSIQPPGVQATSLRESEEYARFTGAAERFDAKLEEEGKVKRCRDEWTGFAGGNPNKKGVAGEKGGGRGTGGAGALLIEIPSDVKQNESGRARS